MSSSLETAWHRVDAWARRQKTWAVEWLCYARCRSSVVLLDRDVISSSGYVVHTLEAALWCLMTNTNYAGTVLEAVNLGLDTDTTGAVAGAMAGLVYGRVGIPTDWLDLLARRDDLVALAARTG